MLKMPGLGLQSGARVAVDAAMVEVDDRATQQMALVVSIGSLGDTSDLLRAAPGHAPADVPGDAPVVRIVRVDPHVIDVESEEQCWTRGDSGTLFFDGAKAVAMLIAGSPECAGRQTAVRLGPLIGWIRAVAR